VLPKPFAVATPNQAVKIQTIQIQIQSIQIESNSLHYSTIIMGNKTYFEFLEEEFQVLASQLQTNISKIAADTSYDNPDKPKAVATAGKQVSRCKAVLQQLRAECKSDPDFKDRANLYKIQLEALTIEYQRHQ
jgi:hypothetical protein